MRGHRGAAAVHVDPQNFVRAESHFYMSKRVDAGMFGEFVGVEPPGPSDDQPVVRMNRDVLCCWAVLDLDQPAVVTLPETGRRYMSMRVINEDHHITSTVYEHGEHVLDRDSNGTRYAHIAIRFFVDPSDPEDLAIAKALRDRVTVAQSEVGAFEIPDWDDRSRTLVRTGLKTMGSTLRHLDGMFGSVDEVDPVMHLIGTAGGWGGGPARDAMFLNGTPEKNNGTIAYALTVPASVPVDGFWSVTVYTEDGYLWKNDRDLYTRSDATSTPDPDGSVTVRFGGDPDAPNFLPIFPDWNYTIRLYRPRPEILDGSWVFPAPQPAD
ncbi:DUF1214 domain-containing protein [Nocardia jejuensis]|uniref:DUF1214 domain-containing protein n=1 Tax=Nocardia jejuensis TaxID=328049 RepID=UPI000A9497E9|nr:DUF1214 domain-containing protein [Nocardia jejuensis]